MNLQVKVICGSLNFSLDRLIELIGVLGIDQKSTWFVSLVTDHLRPALFTLRLIHKLRLNWLTCNISTVLSRIDNIIGLVDAQHEDTRRNINQHPFGINELPDEKKLLEESASNVSAQPFKLINLLEDFRRLSAMDPRDRIYATIGLAMDYGLPPANVFEAFAAHLIRKGDGISVLHAAISHSQGTDLPSWVPDWTSQKCTYVPLNLLLDPSIRAGSKMTPNLDPLNDKNVIRLSGCSADQIWLIGRELGPELAEKTATDEGYQFIAMLFNDQVSAPDHDGREWSVREGIKDNRLDQMRKRNRAFWYPKWLSWLSIIMSLKIFVHLQPKELQAVTKRRGEWQANLPIAHNARILSDDNDGAPPTTSYVEPAARSFGDLEALMVEAVDPAAFPPAPNPECHTDENCNLLENRCLCITRNGRLGLVPKTAQEGDEILIIPGSVTPFVIRGSGKANEDVIEGRRLVGDCYSGFDARRRLARG